MNQLLKLQVYVMVVKVSSHNTGNSGRMVTNPCIPLDWNDVPCRFTVLKFRGLFLRIISLNHFRGLG